MGDTSEAPIGCLSQSGDTLRLWRGEAGARSAARWEVEPSQGRKVSEIIQRYCKQILSIRRLYTCHGTGLRRLSCQGIDSTNAILMSQPCLCDVCLGSALSSHPR